MQNTGQRPGRPRFSIAMATYNGATYLPAQLDSIARQTWPPFELQVGDDGSTDATHAIIRDFAARVPFPVRLTVNPRRLGFADNFLATATRCSGDWVALCDQDDVWLDGRLQDLAEAIETQTDDDTLLVVQTAEVVDGALSPVGARIPKLDADRRIPRRGHPCFWVLPGMIQVLRTRLFHDFDWGDRPRDYITPSWEKQAHDKWTTMMANALGDTLYVIRPGTLYRRHGATVTGYVPDSRRFRRLHSFFTEGNKDYGYLTAVAEESAAHLARLAAAAHPDDALRLHDSAADFRRLAAILANRETIWTRGAWMPRLSAVAANLRLGAYAPRAGYRIGRMALAKDILRLLY